MSESDHERRWRREEVAGRGGRNDALLVIDNVVYDVTPFLDEHPGGAEVLLDNAGGDASQCFHDVGHSDDARAWRQRFRVGQIVTEQWQEPPRRNDWGGEGIGAGASPRAVLAAVAPPALLAALATLLYQWLY